jgi:hypothetical protein
LLREVLLHLHDALNVTKAFDQGVEFLHRRFAFFL